MDVLHNVVVNSHERLSSSASSTDFEVILYSTLSNVSKIQLNWIQIPNSIYNISSSNNIVTFTENATLKTATIPVSAYNSDELATELASILTTASGGYNTYTVTYNTETYMFTFSATNAFMLNCSKAKFPYHELGFSNSDTSSATSITSSYIVSLEQPNELIVSIHETDSLLITGDTQFGATFIIPNKAFLGEVLTFVSNVPMYMVLSEHTTITNLCIGLKDRYRNTIGLNGADWSMSLTMYLKKS